MRCNCCKEIHSVKKLQLNADNMKQKTAVSAETLVKHARHTEAQGPKSVLDNREHSHLNKGSTTDWRHSTG